MPKWYRLLMMAYIILLSISVVSAEGSIILDSTEASVDLSGEALVFCAILIATFAILVIVKILLSRGES